jgi:hypothetical protein
VNSVSVTVCRRPEYTRQTLKALKRCDGVNSWEVAVFVDRQCEETLSLVVEEALPCWMVAFSESPIGCNENVRKAFEHGFSLSGYHVHLEDDTVPSRDALAFFLWGRQFGKDAGVFCVNAYSKRGGRVDGARQGQDITAWGIATWRDRWDEMRSNWSSDQGIAWDTWLDRHVRNGRDTITPDCSRIQNIGEHNGTYGNPGVWAAHQFTNAMVPDGTSVCEWRLE